MHDQDINWRLDVARDVVHQARAFQQEVDKLGFGSPARPPVAEFNPTGQRFFAAVVATDPDDPRPAHLMFPHPGYHQYEVYEWLAPRGYQLVATLNGSPNAGDSRTLAIDYAAWLNERFPVS